MSQDEVFASPSTYIQGKNVLFRSYPYIKKLGSRAVLLTGKHMINIAGKKYAKYLQDSGIQTKIAIFQGESSMDEIDRVAKIGKSFKAQVIIGLGGGKTLDSAKAIADKLGIHVAILPTLASTDAPCSRLSVIYHDDGSFANYLFYKRNPDLVLVDTRIIANAPKRFLVSGLGDALATNVEAQAVAKGNGNNMLNAKQTLVGNAIAQKCEDTLLKYGKEAAISVGARADTKAVDKISEANILMSGLGFESGGLAAAHAIYNGTTVLGNKIHMMHGEIVAFGLLTQLFLEGADKARVNKYLGFELSVGLPTTFEALGIPNISDEDLMRVAKAADAKNDTMTQMPFKITPDDIVQAMKGADAYSKAYQASHK